MPTPYVYNPHPLLTSFPQELRKLAIRLVEWDKEVEFFKREQKCAGHHKWICYQQERIQSPHYSVMQHIMASTSPFHKEWIRRIDRRSSAMGLTPPPIRRLSLSMQSWSIRCRQGKWPFSLCKWSPPSITCGSCQSRSSPAVYHLSFNC